MREMSDLYVTWDEYHTAIERLAARVHASDWEFNQIVCIARGGLRIGDTMSRIFDTPLAIRRWPSSSRNPMSKTPARCKVRSLSRRI
jgi:hypoxanthine phosphoribosyltransferase